jgi:lipid-A-disaccharide synthase
MKSCLLIAGEKSGEEHALSFFSDLKIKSPETSFFGVGGDELKSQGLELLYHLNDFSSWGYSEVFAKIPFYINAMKAILEEVEKRQTKVAILIDFQSFNLKLAGKLKERGVEVLYYVAPQAWAWKEYRVKKLSQSVHTLFTIIPFEKKWFSDRGVKKVISIDHPLLTTYQKELAQYESHPYGNPVKLLLLPGSRHFEVEKLLPEFIQAYLELKKKINISLSIVKSSSVSSELYAPYDQYFDSIYSNEELVSSLKRADFAFAASGTVTLTCALFEVPTIVCYKTSLINQFIFETFVKYNWFISLANIIHNCSVFPELLQDSVSSYNIVSEFQKWYYNHKKYQDIKNVLKETKQLVKGEEISIPHYMSQVLERCYGKNLNSHF